MRKNQSMICVVLVLLLSLGVSTFSWAARKDPMTLLKDTQAKISKIVDQKDKEEKKKAEEIKKIIEPFFDFDHLSKQALKKHWAKRTADERTSYQFWVKALIENAYLRSFNQGLKKKDDKDAGIDYKKQKVGKKKATVFTKVKYRDPKNKRLRRIRVDWVFFKKGKDWLVADIVTNDNSLVETYEEQFDKIINKKSFKELMRRIRKKVNQLRKKAGLKPLKDPVEAKGADK